MQTALQCSTWTWILDYVSFPNSLFYIYFFYYSVDFPIVQLIIFFSCFYYFKVTLKNTSADYPIEGFFIQARQENSNTPLGYFIVSGNDVHTLTCKTTAVRLRANHLIFVDNRTDTICTMLSQFRNYWLHNFRHVNRSISLRKPVLYEIKKDI